MHFTRLDCSPVVAEKLWRKHAVELWEVHEALNSGAVHIRRGRDGLWEVSCRTDAGRYLFVVLRVLSPGRARLLTARDMTRRERRTFAGR